VLFCVLNAPEKLIDFSPDMSPISIDVLSPSDPVMPDPLAYLLTWTTYGTWLPGDDRGWVRRGKGLQTPQFETLTRAATKLRETPLILDKNQRDCVENTIRQHCAYRHWQLLAVNCRTNHVHAVVATAVVPDVAVKELKAWCTRRLREVVVAGSCHSQRKNWWSERSSTRYLVDPESVESAVRYVIDGQ
jgi:REP element-mobilizing transposase RayT